MSTIEKPQQTSAVTDYVVVALRGRGRILLGDAPQQDSSWDGIVARMGLCEIQAFYRRDDNYVRLCGGEVGSNLIYKYKAVSLAFSNQEWAKYLGEILKEVVDEQPGADEAERQQARHEIDFLVAYVKAKLAGILDANGDLEPKAVESRYAVDTWLKEGGPLRDHLRSRPVAYVFEYTEDQLVARRDYFRRYGTDANALSKIVTRVSNVESLVRRLRAPESVDACVRGPKEAEKDLFIRYTLSG